MGKIFGISDLPVAIPFPWLKKTTLSGEKSTTKIVEEVKGDVFVSKTRQIQNKLRAKMANKTK